MGRDSPYRPAGPLRCVLARQACLCRGSLTPAWASSPAEPQSQRVSSAQGRASLSGTSRARFASCRVRHLVTPSAARKGARASACVRVATILASAVGFTATRARRQVGRHAAFAGSEPFRWSGGAAASWRHRRFDVPSRLYRAVRVVLPAGRALCMRTCERANVWVSGASKSICSLLHGVRYVVVARAARSCTFAGAAAPRPPCVATGEWSAGFPE